MGKRHEDAFGPLADEVDLLYARDTKQALAQGLRFAHQQRLRFAPRLQGKQRKGHVRVFIVHHRTDDARRQVWRFVMDLFACLVELLLHLRRWRVVAQLHHGEGQAGTGVRLRVVVPAQLLHALFQELGDLILHLLSRRARPGGYDGHLLDREWRVFRTPQLEEGDDACHGDQEDQEKRDRALADGERREIESAHFSRPPRSTTAAVCVARETGRIFSPSCSNWAPKATTWTPPIKPLCVWTRSAAAPGKPSTSTARHVTCAGL